MDNFRDGNQILKVCSSSRSALFVVYKALHDQSFRLFANKLSTTSHITLFHFAWSLQCFIASRKSHHSVYILVTESTHSHFFADTLKMLIRPSKRHPFFPSSRFLRDFRLWKIDSRISSYARLNNRAFVLRKLLLSSDIPENTVASNMRWPKSTHFCRYPSLHRVRWNAPESQNCK